MRIVYCEDCEWEQHDFGGKEHPKCSHELFRNDKEYAYRQTESERYPFCSNVNIRGRCSHFEEKPSSIGRNLITIWKGWFGK